MKNLGKKNYLYPMPVLIVGTYDKDGNPNLMNAAWGGTYDTNQLFVCLGEHKTTDNLELSKGFTIGVGDAKNVVACDYVGLVSGRTVVDKVKKSGFTVTKSEFVNAPVVNELPITIECTIDSFVNGILVGNIVNTKVREDILGEDGLPDLSKFSPITFDPVHHKYIELGKEVGLAFHDGKALIK